MSAWAVRYLAIAVLSLAGSAVASAASGISDMASTQACWVGGQYALAKTQTEGGRYPARLVRARPVNDGDIWAFPPNDFEGIVPIDTLVSDVERVAITPRFAVVARASGGYAVVDLTRENGEAQAFDSLDAVNRHTRAAGADPLRPEEFRTFDEVYRVLRPQRDFPWVLVTGGAIMSLTLATAAIRWRYRTRRGRRRPPQRGASSFATVGDDRQP